MTSENISAFLLYFSVGTGVLWWLYVDSRNALNTNKTSVFGKEVASDNVKALLVYAIGATIFTVSTPCMEFLFQNTSPLYQRVINVQCVYIKRESENIYCFLI